MSFKIYEFEITDDNWDDIEVLPIEKIGHKIYQPCNAGEESMWCVFLHFKNGGVECIADFSSKETACSFANFLYEHSTIKSTMILD